VLTPGRGRDETGTASSDSPTEARYSIASLHRLVLLALRECTKEGGRRCESKSQPQATAASANRGGDRSEKGIIAATDRDYSH